MFKDIKKNNRREINSSVNQRFHKGFAKYRYIIVLVIIFIGFLFFGQKKTDVFAINDNDRIYGNKDAKITLIEYLDFECEACKANYPIIKKIKQEFHNELKVVVRYFPLDGHQNSNAAAKAVESAGIQGKYREMHDLLFEEQDNWSKRSPNNQKGFSVYAQKLNLDIKKFEQDIYSKQVQSRIEIDKKSGKNIGVKGTPSFFLNGQKIQNPKNIEDFRMIIKAEILKYPVKRGEKVHEHSDIKIYINNKNIDLSQDKYQSTTGKELSAAQHLHDKNGDNIHKHLTDDNIGGFLSSLGIKLDTKCIILDTGEKYCNDGKNALKFFVNDEENKDFDKYEFKDLDRVLISYGSENEEQIKKQIASVTSNACMYSNKCPEKGKPPTENCVVGMGGEC